MENGNEMSSSLSFLSNGSSTNVSALTNNESSTNPESLSLSRLSVNLEKLLIDSEYNYSDAEIIVEDIPVGVHKCILASRSQFFHELFKKGSSSNGDKPKYKMSDLVSYGVVGYEAFCVFLHYLYTGRLKPSPPEVSNCVDDGCLHDSCRPAINYALELLFASATFQMKELVLLSQRRLLNCVDKALVEDVIPILLAAFHCQLEQLLSQCIQRIARSDFDSVCLEKELPDEVSNKIKLLRCNCQQEADAESCVEKVDPVFEKNSRKILKALGSDDVELMKLLLEESSVTLNDVFALHYAVAYSDTKIVKEVLSLGWTDVNLRNSRGYTVLHVAARRKEPSVLVELLQQGARALETTLNGQSAVTICRRLTRPKDYVEDTKQGQITNKDRLCINILERGMRNSMSADVSISYRAVFEDQCHQLDYLENRVRFAQLLFPAEARVAMDIADARNLREVDLNEEPEQQAKKIQQRLQALLKTVETGRRYFPHCSEVIDKFIDDDMPDAFFLDTGSVEEQKIKRKRYMELKEDVQKAFYKDRAESKLSTLSASSSSSSSPKKVNGSKRRK